MNKKTSLYNLNKIEELNERQAEILFKLNKAKHKIYSIKEVQNIFGTAYQTARTDLLSLVDEGFLHQKQSGKKILFRRSENFDALMNSKISRPS